MNKTAIINSNSWSEKLWTVIKLLLKIGVTTLLLYYVFSKVDLKKITGLITKSNPLWMLLALAVYFISTIVSASRLLSFFRSINLHLDFRFNFRLYLLGMFYNLCLPGGIGGDGYKIYLLSKNYNLPAKKAFWAILFDRLSGFWAIGLITATLVPFIPLIKINPFIPFGGFAIGSIIYYFVTHKFFKEYTRHFFEAHAKAVLVQSLQVITILLVLNGLHYSGKYAPYLITFLISALAAVFPFTLGGLGAREFIFTHFADYLKMDANLAVFISLSFYVISAIVSLLGVYYVFNTSQLQEGLPSQQKEDID